MRYVEIPPGPALRGVVRCYWSLVDAPAAPQPEHVVPDGCAEIVCNRADPIARLTDEATRRQTALLLVGQLRSAITLLPGGVVDLVGIRFEPGGLHEVLGIPMHELTDRDVAVSAVRRGLRARLADALRDEGIPACLPVVERVLLAERARSRAPRWQAGLVRAASLRLEGRGARSEQVAHDLGVSRRSLERVFRDAVGLSPKRYQRIRRLQGVVRALERGRPPAGWAALAVDHGYFDQSHLIRDFRLLVGLTPEGYLGAGTHLADAFAAGVVTRSSNP